MLKWLGIRKVSGGADTLAAPATSPTISQPDENLRLSVTAVLTTSMSQGVSSGRVDS
jgi:hypothetical protein